MTVSGERRGTFDDSELELLNDKALHYQGECAEIHSSCVQSLPVVKVCLMALKCALSLYQANIFTVKHFSTLLYFIYTCSDSSSANWNAFPMQVSPLGVKCSGSRLTKWKGCVATSSPENLSL